MKLAAENGVKNYKSFPAENGAIPTSNAGELKQQCCRGRFACTRIPSWYFAELKEVFILAWPMIMVFCCFNVMAPISLMFAGHLGTKELGGVALGNTILSVSGLMVANGMSCTLDTLFSQAYGSTNKKQVGIYLQRGMVIICTYILPCWAIHMNTERLMLLLGQDPDIARIAGRYTLVFMPGLPAQFIFAILNSYLRSQNKVLPIVAVGLSGVAVNALFQYILVYLLDMGTDGSSWGQVLGFWMITGCGLLYIKISKMYTETWGGLTMELFQDWGVFMKLEIAGMLMICLQFWAFEVGTIVAGRLDDVQLAAQAVMLQLELLTYSVPIGIGVGTNVRVGQLVGANNIPQAKRAVISAYTLALGMSVIVMVLLNALRLQIPKIFSSDNEVIEYTANLLPILSLFHIFDCTAGISTGVLRGCGRQPLAAIIIFIAMYVIGLPTGIALMLLTKLKTAGFWWGMTISIFLEVLLYTIAVFRTDWEKEADMAQVRSGLRKADEGPEANQNRETDTELQQTTPLVEPMKKQPTSLLVLYRTLFIFGMLLTLGIGVYIKLYFPVMAPQTNGTMTANQNKTH